MKADAMINDQQQSSAERAKRAHDIAKGLADQLGSEWSYKAPIERFPTAYVARGDGAQLAVHLKGWGADAGKCVIAGVIPGSADHRGEIEAPMIGVNGSKDIASIARDVTRRLLPEYEAVFVIASEKLAIRRAVIARRVETIHAIASAVPALIRELRIDGNDAHRPRLSIGCGDDVLYGDVVAGDAIAIPDHATVSIEVNNVPSDVAIAMLKVIAEHAKNKGRST